MAIQHPKVKAEFNAGIISGNKGDATITNIIQVKNYLGNLKLGLFPVIMVTKRPLMLSKSGTIFTFSFFKVVSI